MADYLIKPSSASGRMQAPPSKSHCLRAILFASLAEAESRITNLLASPDTDAMIQACRAFGASIDYQQSSLVITGVAGKPRLPENVIDVGNSGQVLRFVGALAGLIDGYSIFTGDASIRRRRPVQPLLDGLQQLGGFAVSSKADGHAPMIIKGPIKAGVATINGSDSQPVSGLLIASALLDGVTCLQVKNAKEQAWVGLTLSWLERFNIPCKQENFQRYEITGPNRIPAFDYQVPGDFSSIAFPLAAAILSQRSLEISGLDLNDAQGDKQIIKILCSMGARIELQSDCIRVLPGNPLVGQTIDVNACIDAVPILAVLACFASGQTRLVNAAIARQKESDRLAAIRQELAKMGAAIELSEAELSIRPAKLKARELHSHHDHRIAMALAVAALKADGQSRIVEIDCVRKSFPDFAQVMQNLGADIEVLK